MELQRWWGQKNKTFGQKSTYSKEKNLKNSVDELQFENFVPKSYFQSQFLMSKIDRIYFYFFIGEHQFRRPFLLKTFFSGVNFWATLLLKSCPIFDELKLIDRIFFSSSMLFFGQKSCFLAPTIFETPQPNWYYYKCSVCIFIKSILFITPFKKITLSDFIQ